MDKFGGTMDRHCLLDVTNGNEEPLTMIDKGGVRRATALESNSVNSVLGSKCCLKQCCNLFCVTEISECRKEYWSLTQYQQQHWLKRAIRHSKDEKFLIHGHLVCEKAFRNIYSVGHRRFWTLKKAVIDKTEKASFPHVMLTREPMAHAINWMKGYITKTTDKLPDRAELHLPACIQKKDVYKKYCSEMLNAGVQTVCKSSFYEMWSKKFQHVKISKGKENLPHCTTCVNIREGLQQEMNKVDRLKFFNYQKEHIRLQDECRLKYYKHIKKGRESELSERGRHLSVIIDNMDQAKTRLPHFSTNTKAESVLHKLQHHLTGVKIHNNDSSFMLTWTDDQHPDSNITINALVFALSEYSKTRSNTLPEILYLQMDNSPKDNKNVFLLLFLAWLVKNRIFRKVKVGFLMVGHTHEDIDQLFSRVSNHLKKCNAYTLTDLHEEINKSFQPFPMTHHMHGIFDYKKSLENSRGCLQGVAGPHHYILKMVEGQTVLFYRDWPSQENAGSMVLDEHIPCNFLRDLTIPNTKIQAAQNYVITDLPKWQACGRLPAQAVEWWINYLSKLGKASVADVPFVDTLPVVHVNPPLPQTELVASLLSSVQSVLTVHRKKSVLNLKKRKK